MGIDRTSYAEASAFASIEVSNSAFFNAIKRRASKRSEELVEKFTQRMLAILQNRRSLIGGARYPRWTPSAKERHPSLKSFKQWKKMTKDTGGQYSITTQLYNPAVSKKGFNYPALLISGDGAPKRWGETIKRGETLRGEPAKVVGTPGGKIFSSQMPQGLDPWLKYKRGQLEEELAAMLSTRERYKPR